MPAESEDTFFDVKRPWSHYKDRVLDYYLVPYLQKVKLLRQPIVIFDMFAGRGKFKSGEPGSPLIIANRLAPLYLTGTPVKLVCIEQRADYADVLTDVLRPFSFATVHRDNSLNRINEIEQESRKATIFLYVDPWEVAQLDLTKLATVYQRVKSSSVEVLLVFMARAFLRQACQILRIEGRLLSEVFWDKLVQESEGEHRDFWVHELYDGTDVKQYDYVQRARTELTRVAGGTYWEQVAAEPSNTFNQKLVELVEQYKLQLGRWFKVCLSLPIYDLAGERIPKYWLVFGSRYRPATDLMNGAAADVRRDQDTGYRKQDGSLFSDVVVDTHPEPAVVQRALARHGFECPEPATWEELRWRFARTDLGRFTSSEIDRAIKALLKDGTLAGADGGRIEKCAKLRWTRVRK